VSNSSTHELRFTETNSADDSAGKTWGLEGNLFWFLAGGAFASVVTLLLLFSVLKSTLLSALVPSLIPIGLTLLYVFAFRQGKPSGYDIDLFELWLKGPGFGPEPPRMEARSSSTTNDNV
jgi:hypothetical protein